jgi:hypothetical protein
MNELNYQKIRYNVQECIFDVIIEIIQIIPVKQHT